MHGSWPRTPTFPVRFRESYTRAVDNRASTTLVEDSRKLERGGAAYRQDGSQISMFHVDCEIGSPVSTGYNQAKFVMTSAT
jgi:hypothetical protein